MDGESGFLQSGVYVVVFPYFQVLVIGDSTLILLLTTNGIPTAEDMGQRHSSHNSTPHPGR